MTVGSEMEMAGVMGKLKETAGSEVEMVAGTESGVDTEVGTDLKSTADRSGAVAGAKASTGSVIATAGGDAGVDMRSMVAGTTTGDGAMAVVGVRVGLIAEMILSACAVASEFSALVNVWLGIAGMETEWVG